MLAVNQRNTAGNPQVAGNPLIRVEANEKRAV
jgi:hypothetical protein